jgi:hypothetical protein
VNGEEFRVKVAEHMQEILKLNKTKGDDYSRGGADAFDNFRRHARELGLAPEQIWAVYASKHWDAVMTFIRNIEDGGYEPSEAIDGRIDDLILYLHLLREMMHDEEDEGDEAPKFKHGDDVIYRDDDGGDWKAIVTSEPQRGSGEGWTYRLEFLADDGPIGLPGLIREGRLRAVEPRPR